MHTFTLYKCAYRVNEHNAYYPQKVKISGAEDLRGVVMYDHVAATYRNNHRYNDDFIQSDCIMLDLDNTHSDDPADWKTPDDVAAAFPGVEFYAVESRSHMKIKDGKAARPKHHYYFPINTVTNAEKYKQYKEWIISLFRFNNDDIFDRKAKDSARMFYGVENPTVYHYGGVTNAD